jgi:hypothetical protein
MLGTGFPEESLRAGLERSPAFMGVDSGSTDQGPQALGTGQPLLSRQAVRRDLSLLLPAALKHGIPLLVGSSGTSGCDDSLDWLTEVLRDVAAEQGLHPRVALIRAEQDPERLVEELRAGRIHPLGAAPALDEATLRRARRVVAMMGPEPFAAALDAGAQVVLAGRATDAAIFAAPLLRAGAPAGPSWHAGKILECGAAAVTARTAPDGMLGHVTGEGFTIEPLNPAMRCTPLSVAAHALYETADPTRLIEPPGTLVTLASRYEQAEDGRSVHVTGSTFEPAARYTVKLEGAELAGYQTIVPAAVRDPLLLAQLDEWVETLLVKIRERAQTILGDALEPGSWSVGARVYGRDGAMGALEPERRLEGHEALLIFEFTAPEQQHATAIAKTAGLLAMHHPIAGWEGFVNAVAFPYAPYEIERGAVWRFSLNHVWELDDPLAPFPIELVEV